MIQKYFKVALYAVALMAACACSSEDDTDDTEDVYFYINSSTIQMNSEGGNISRSIESNVRWSVSTTEYYNWLKVSPMSGNGNGTLQISVSPNTSSSARYAYMEIKPSNPSATTFTLCVAQNGNGSNTGGGNTGGGNTQQKPDAPTGVTVSNEGSASVPDVRVRWNAVSNATTYYIYKSSSANGSYSKIGESAYTSFGDSNAPKNGASAYYKVKAVNSAGESAFSNYAQYTSLSNDEAFSPAYTYGNCTVSGNNMTLRWTNSSGYGYGKATECILRVWNPYAEEWQDTKLSATATSTTFDYSTKIDKSGYVKAGIVVSNAKGSFAASPKVYDTNSKRWIN